MASIKKKSSGGGGANWMDTYGDMVTLLLCFFVLLYSISTIDQDKCVGCQICVKECPMGVIHVPGAE